MMTTAFLKETESRSTSRAPNLTVIVALLGRRFHGNGAYPQHREEKHRES